MTVKSALQLGGSKTTRLKTSFYSLSLSAPFCFSFFSLSIARNILFIINLPLLLLSHFSRVRLCATHRRQPTRLRHPWDSPGKNTGVGCHFFLQCMKVNSKSEVALSCPTLSKPMDCSLPGKSTGVGCHCEDV